MKQLFNFRYAFMAVALACAGAGFTACEDDIEISNVNPNPWGDVTSTLGGVRSAAGARMGTELTVKNNASATGHVYFELNKATDTPVKVTFKVDEEALKAYNAANGTAYQMYPGAVTLEDGGVATIEAGKKSTKTLKVNIPSGGNAGTTYAVAISATADNGVTAASNTASYVYLVRPITVPDATEKGDIFNLCYVEVNNNSILNAGEYTVDGVPFFNAVSIFAANINLDSDGAPYVSCNENVQFVLHNADKIIRPLQEKGIKVHLSILGNRDAAGMRSLSDEGAKIFAQRLREYVDIYGLDGIDFDDEYSSYASGYGPYNQTSTAVVASEDECTQERYANLIYECRQQMPKGEVMFGIYWYQSKDWPKGPVKGQTVSSMIDYTVYGSYGSRNDHTLGTEVEAKQQAPYAITLTGANTGDGNPIPYKVSDTNLDKNLEANNGYMAFYDLKPSRSAEAVFNQVAKKLYSGKEVEWSGKYYGRTDVAALQGKTRDYDSYVGTWKVTSGKTFEHDGSWWQERGESQTFTIDIKKKEDGKSYYVYGWESMEGGNKTVLDVTAKYPFVMNYVDGELQISDSQTIHESDADDKTTYAMSFSTYGDGDIWRTQTVSGNIAFRGDMAPDGTIVLHNGKTSSKAQTRYGYSLFEVDGETYTAVQKPTDKRPTGWFTLTK